jgi:hypothetical protein
MRKNTVVLDFLKFPVPTKVTFGRTVVFNMSKLTLFANPDVPYDKATSVINNLETTYMASRSGDHEQVALMRQAEVEYDDIFRKLAYNVDRVADGDEAIILSSGFHLAKQPTPAERPEFTVTAGDTPGTISLKRKAVAGAYSYVWQHFAGAEVPTDAQWLLAGSTTQTSFEMTGLTSATKVWFRVAAVTAEGMGAFTDPIMKVVP